MRGKSVPDEDILAAIICSPSLEAAADACGISRHTVYRRMQEPQFKAALEKHKAQVLEQACATLQARMQAAAETLADVMLDKKASKMVRVMAAKTLLEFGFKSVEVANILTRLDALETQSTEHSRQISANWN